MPGKNKGLLKRATRVNKKNKIPGSNVIFDAKQVYFTNNQAAKTKKTGSELKPRPPSAYRQQLFVPNPQRKFVRNFS